jgi:hypothetical protein
MDLQPAEVWLGGPHPSILYFQVIAVPQQEVFKLFVLAERTVQLASLSASAYTEFAAISHRSFGLAPCEPGRTYAAERACPQRQPGLVRFLFLTSPIIF